MLSLLFGCGLRRAELVALELRDLQRREDHWVLVDLIGKGKHIRTVPVPNWVQAAVAAWTTVAQSRRAVYSAAPDATGASGAVGSPIRCLARGEEVRQGDRVAEAGPARLPAHVCSSLPRSRRRVGANSVSARPRVRRDHRAVPGLHTATQTGRERPHGAGGLTRRARSHCPTTPFTPATGIAVRFDISAL